MSLINIVLLCIFLEAFINAYHYSNEYKEIDINISNKEQANVINTSAQYLFSKYGLENFDGIKLISLK